MSFTDCHKCCNWLCWKGLFPKGEPHVLLNWPDYHKCRWSSPNQQDFYGCWNRITGLLLQFHICLDEIMAQSRPPPLQQQTPVFVTSIKVVISSNRVKTPLKCKHLHVFLSVQLYSSRLLYQPPGAPGTSELCQPAANPNQVTLHHSPSWISSLKYVSNDIPMSSPKDIQVIVRGAMKKEVLTLRS